MSSNYNQKQTGSEQGDINTTPIREKYWHRNLSPDAKKIFKEDNRYFMHQSLSTPVLKNGVQNTEIKVVK